ncbi:hypothetical protein BGZ93_004776 [Podila epicladia]|nr:hypothetical protein BGZ92_000379 [Podila epicladia]KAG0100006.1 hypothetical protein BGZ93_004776 [Podila epicladia]
MENPALNNNHPESAPPKVMIAGAGIAGLLLGILLDKAGIPFHIYERSATIKPLGALMSLGANILPLLDQIGLYKDLQDISLPCYSFLIYSGDDEMKLLGNMGNPEAEELTGYPIVVFARHRLYELLLKQIPPEKISFSQKVVSISEDKDGVTIQTADNQIHRGDILVGADGTYSVVRQSMYATMEKNELLPEVDKHKMSKGYACLVGTTDPLDPAKYPGLMDPTSHSILVLSDKTPYNWSAFTVPDGRICWNAVLQLDEKQSQENEAKGSQWGPGTSAQMTEEIRDFITPYGTMGDLIDATPKDVISQVYLEDKLFETWHHGRVVLIGDGAVNAMQDAVILANCLRDLESSSPEAIHACFADFREQRYAHVKEQYEASQMNAKLIYGQTLMERTLRYIVFNWMPRWVMRKGAVKDLLYRPLAMFLPLPEARGTLQRLPQKPCKKGLVDQHQTSVV